MSDAKEIIVVDEYLKGLLALMSNQPPAIRQGALTEVIKLLTTKTELSKNDVRQVAKHLLPPPKPLVVQTDPPKKKAAKEKKQRVLDKRIVALQKLHAPETRVIGSEYATAMVALRAEIKAEKLAKKK